MWRHFENAENWGHHEVENHQLTYEEFRLAVKTFCANYEHEIVTDEQIKEDFVLLDFNFNGSVSFIEICKHCCKFISEIEKPSEG